MALTKTHPTHLNRKRSGSVTREPLFQPVHNGGFFEAVMRYGIPHPSGGGHFIYYSGGGLEHRYRVSAGGSGGGRS